MLKIKPAVKTKKLKIIYSNGRPSVTEQEKAFPALFGRSNLEGGQNVEFDENEGEREKKN